jgi:hypothetical protein
VQVLTLVSKVPEDGHVTLPGRMCHRVVESASGRRTPRTRSAPIDRIISSFPAASLGLRARSGALISGRLSGFLCARYPADPSGLALPVPPGAWPRVRTVKDLRSGRRAGARRHRPSERPQRTPVAACWRWHRSSGPLHLVAERTCRMPGDVSVRLNSSDRRADEDLHPTEYRIGLRRQDPIG